LISRSSPDEIIAIVGHEIGHSKFNHIWIKLFVQAIFVGNFITLFSSIIKLNKFYTSFSFEAPDPSVGFILFSYSYGSFASFLSTLVNLMSRSFEYSADQFALSNGLDMKQALTKLHALNIANIASDRFYSIYHYSHPSLSERLERLQRIETLLVFQKKTL